MYSIEWSVHLITIIANLMKQCFSIHAYIHTYCEGLETYRIAGIFRMVDIFEFNYNFEILVIE